MKIEDSEKKYGKRWDKWTEEEILDHVKQLDITEINIPLNLRFAVEHFEYLPTDARLYLTMCRMQSKARALPEGEEE